MRRPALPFLVALVASIVPAAVGIAPDAQAAYLPVAGQPAVVDGLDAGMTSSPVPATPPQSRVELKKIPTLHALENSSGGNMAPSPSGSGGSGPSTGFVPPTEVPPTNLVVYFRESADRFDLPTSVMFLLDPPRS